MVSEELKSRVAENCPGYTPPFDVRLLSSSASAVSCENCKHWESGRCVIDYFDGVTDMLNRN